VLQVRNLEAHEVVKTASLHHIFDLTRHFENFWVALVHSHVVEQVIKDVSYHLNLLLGLEIIVDCASALIAHDLLPPLGLDTLQVRQNRRDPVAQCVKALIHLLLMPWVRPHLLLKWLLGPIWVIIWELLVSRRRLPMVLSLALVRRVPVA